MSEQLGRVLQAVGEQSCWPKPLPLPEGLPPVPEFDYELLLPVLRRRVEDTADRMQCPPDFAAVGLMVMLSGIVGRRCGIHPKKHDDWLVVPNLWGMCIGRPGILKTPALDEVLKPIRSLETKAREGYEQAKLDYEADKLVREQSKRVAKDSIRAALKKRDRSGAADLAREANQAEGNEPICERFIVNDSTVEKLGEIMAENPNGLMLYRDELAGFFRVFDRNGHESDRAFYLESWNGLGNYTYDRIGRGTINIPAVCLAVLGNIQPGPLGDLVRGMRGRGDDGLLQRFQLVWPDPSRDWRNVDRAPDREARDEVQALVQRIAASAPQHDSDEIPALRFDDAAQAVFDAWRAVLERRLRQQELHAMMESHLAKYRSLVPSLALLDHIAFSGFAGSVSESSVIRAIAWAEYLEPHARRIYAPAISPDMDAARTLAAKIASGAVGARFNLRDIYNKGWSGLSTRDEVAGAVAVLDEYDWLRQHQEQTRGRTRTVYELNPALVEKQA